MRLLLIFALTFVLSAQQGLAYYESVPGGLHPGMAVYVTGKLLRNANVFGMNFAVATHEGPDIPFHFNPRFEGWNTLVLNTFKSGSWGKEQTPPNPFRKGEHFEINIIVTEAGYLILVNKNQFNIYRHRIPPQRVQFITIGGDLELQSLNVIAKPIIGKMANDIRKAIETEGNIQSAMQVFGAVPHYESVPDGLHPGMAVYVTGRVLRNVDIIGMNFAVATHEGPDIPFHFNPRFDGWNTLVLNTFQSGRWGEEEKYPNPFQKGGYFEIIVVVTQTGYQILVNKNQFNIYRHRIPPQRVRFITIGGALELHSLNVMDKPVIGNMVMPSTSNIPGGMGPEKIITVQGSIPKNAIRFEINFMAGQDIPLRIDFQMKPLSAVIRNSLLNGNWGKEERSLTFNPLQAGQYFKLTIYCDNLEFKVYANDQPFFNYAHRYLHIEHIRTLEINGDVTLSYIKY